MEGGGNPCRSLEVGGSTLEKVATHLGDLEKVVERKGIYFEKIKREMVDFRVRVSLTLIPCREIENPKKEDSFR